MAVRRPARHPEIPADLLTTDPAIRRLNAEMLFHSGYQVDAAEDGQAAWAALQLHNYDLVVTDNNMPKMTGVELIKKLQDARKFLLNGGQKGRQAGILTARPRPHPSPRASAPARR